jgi:hypothetical protein
MHHTFTCGMNGKGLGVPNPNLFRARSRNKLLDGINSESDVMRDIVDVSDENGRQ